MKLLFLVIMLLPGAVSAAQLGCFVETGKSTCSDQEITCSLGEFNNIATYGQSIGFICDAYVATYNGYLQCVSDRDRARQGWKETIDIGLRYEATLRRLRRACGAKCKRIK